MQFSPPQHISVASVIPFINPRDPGHAFNNFNNAADLNTLRDRPAASDGLPTILNFYEIGSPISEATLINTRANNQGVAARINLIVDSSVRSSPPVSQLESSKQSRFIMRCSPEITP